MRSRFSGSRRSRRKLARHARVRGTWWRAVEPRIGKTRVSQGAEQRVVLIGTDQRTLSYPRPGAVTLPPRPAAGMARGVGGAAARETKTLIPAAWLDRSGQQKGPLVSGPCTKPAVANKFDVAADLLHGVLVITGEISRNANQARCRPLHFCSFVPSVTLYHQPLEVTAMIHEPVEVNSPWLMTFSFEARLNSMMTGQKFSSIPSLSIRPLVCAVFGCEEANTEQSAEIALQSSHEQHEMNLHSLASKPMHHLDAMSASTATGALSIVVVFAMPASRPRAPRDRPGSGP